MFKGVDVISLPQEWDGMPNCHKTKQSPAMHIRVYHSHEAMPSSWLGKDKGNSKVPVRNRPPPDPTLQAVAGVADDSVAVPPL